MDSLGDDSLAILSALLLRRAITVEKTGRGGRKKRASEEEEVEDASSALVEFAHQTVHCSGGQAQVRTTSLQFCVRLFFPEAISAVFITPLKPTPMLYLLDLGRSPASVGH